MGQWWTLTIHLTSLCLIFLSGKGDKNSPKYLMELSCRLNKMWRAENSICVLVAQLCLTLCDRTDCSLPRLLCPWKSPGKNTGMGCHTLLQRIFLTQGSNLGLLHCRQILYHLSQLSKLQEIMEDWGAWCAAVHGVIKNWTRLSNWTTTIMNCPSLILPMTVANFLRTGLSPTAYI